MNQKRESWEERVSLTAINGLIMHLAVLKGVRGPQGGEKGGRQHVTWG